MGKFKEGDCVDWDSDHDDFFLFTTQYGPGPFLVKEIINSMGVPLLHFPGFIGGFPEEYFVLSKRELTEKKKIKARITDASWMPGLIVIENGTPIIDKRGSPFTYHISSGEHELLEANSNPITDFTPLSWKKRKYLKEDKWLMLRECDEVVGLPRVTWEKAKGVELIEQKTSLFTKKKAYEMNKTKPFCVRCDKPTEERAIFSSVIKYCPCTG